MSVASSNNMLTRVTDRGRFIFSNEKNLLTKIPAAWGGIMHTAADWDYKTVYAHMYLTLWPLRDSACIRRLQPDLGGRQLDWTRGKVLGGCTSMNGMVFQVRAIHLALLIEPFADSSRRVSCTVCVLDRSS